MSAHPAAQWVRVTTASPCPVCGHDSWCTVDATDGTTRCKREQSDRPAHGDDGDAWLHSTDGSEPLRQPPPPRPKPAIDWSARHHRYQSNITPELFQELVDLLGVDPQSLRELEVGWEPFTASWSFPMYDATGAICGVRRRPRDGGDKKAMSGAALGILRRVTPDDGQVLICEGESDCAAALTLGHDAIGVPGAGQVSEVAAGYARGREAVIIGDNDEAGERGVQALLGALQGVAKSVRVVRPPAPHKDLRAWLLAGCTREDLADAIEAAPHEGGEPVEEAVPDAPASAPWPDPLGDAVRIGVIGRFLDAVESQTEADQAAMAVDLLLRIGNAVHRGPCLSVSGDRHGCNLFALIIGATAQGRKGTSSAYPRAVMQRADALWSENCCKNGLSSGEGVVWAVRDPAEIGTDKKTGEPIFDNGASDKRLFVLETEFARTLKSAGRRENTLSPILRQAWEGARLATMTKVPYCASDSHISLLAHVTKAEFKGLLSDGDVSGGTINRFLFVASRRQRELPFGGHVSDQVLDEIGTMVAQCIDIARRHAGEMHFTPEARAQWPSIYHDLQADERAPGISGELLGRATAQTRRLAMLFAIAEMSTEVDVQHLRAALEVWRYSRQTVAYVFGTATGNRVADRIIGELRGRPNGMDRSEMFKLFDRHVTAGAINEALALLRTMGLAKGETLKTGGRPREVWRAV